MDKNTKIKIAVGAGFLLGGTTYLAVNNTRSNELFDQWLDYTSSLKIENNPPAQTDISTGLSIYDLAKKYPGDPKKYIKTAGNVPVESIVTDFNTAFAGAGTNVTLFFNTLNKIQNLYTWAFIAKVYEIEFKQSLIDAIKGEALLSGAVSSPSGVIAALFGQGTRLNPAINDFFVKLPEV